MILEMFYGNCFAKTARPLVKKVAYSTLSTFLSNTIFSTLMFISLCVVGLAVNSSILLHLKKRDHRNVDKIIKLRTLFNNFFLIGLFLYCLLNASSILKNYFGYYGCLSFAYHGVFFACYIQCQSFFMALYRYICIIHGETLANFKITGKVNNALLIKSIFIRTYLKTCGPKNLQNLPLLIKAK